MAGIYIHIPFCKQACHYCDFYFTLSLAQKSALVTAITQEIALTKDFLGGEKIETIYFGGGTPSLLFADDFKRIIESIYKFYPEIDLKEMTIEANPDDLNETKISELKSLRAFGLNRLSIGIQSFNDEDLRYLHRAHNAGEAGNALRRVQDSGFENLTIDLIYGIPTLSDENWLFNLNAVASLKIPHLSCYALTVEPRTYLNRNITKGRVAPPNEEHTSRQFDLLMVEMEQLGYEQYEISNFAYPACHALHNSNYWLGRKYLGLGPSAHSYNGILRRWNAANNRIYIGNMNRSEPGYDAEILSETQKANEYIMTSLRTKWGCRLDSPVLKPYLSDIFAFLKNISSEHLEINNNIILLTRKGKHFADRIAAELFIT